MSFSSRRKLLFDPSPTNGFTSESTQVTQQPPPVCTCQWSAHAPQSGPSELPFPRHGHTLTATATAAGELFLFGGWVHGSASSDLYVFSTRDFSTTLLKTDGEVPTARGAHGAALIGTTLFICGGKAGAQPVLNHESLYLLNLGIVSREGTRVVANGSGLYRRHSHTTTVVGSKLFVFGGRIDGKAVNDMWMLDSNCLGSQPLWELYEPTPGNEKPLPRSNHVSVTTEDRIIIFGGFGDQDRYNDTWSFDISTRKWTELQCTGSIPSPRSGHAAVLVDGIMYVFGGFTDNTYLDDLFGLQLSTQRWFRFHNLGPSPYRRAYHTMASEGTRVFLLGGYSSDAREDELSLIHVFDTKDIENLEPERNAVSSNEKITQLAWKSSTGPPTQGPPQYPKSSSSDARGASRLPEATPTVSSRPASLRITHEQKPGPNGWPLEIIGVNSSVLEDTTEGPTEYHAKFAAPHSSSEGEVARLELERQPSVLLAAQTEELAKKSSLLEQALALVKQRDAELVDVQSKLRNTESKLDELLLSFGQQFARYGAELANVRAELEAKKSELEAVRLRFTAANDAKADKLHSVTVASLVDLNEDRDMCELKEDKQAREAESASLQWNEKRRETMERNEG